MDSLPNCVDDVKTQILAHIAYCFAYSNSSRRTDTTLSSERTLNLENWIL